MSSPTPSSTAVPLQPLIDYPKLYVSGADRISTITILALVLIMLAIGVASVVQAGQPCTTLHDVGIPGGLAMVASSLLLLVIYYRGERRNREKLDDLYARRENLACGHDQKTGWYVNIQPDTYMFTVYKKQSEYDHFHRDSTG